jgi:hypothetical protein
MQYFLVMCSHGFLNLNFRTSWLHCQIPELLGSNHQQWRKLLRMALLMLGLEWVLDKKCPIEPEKVVRGAQETDDAWKAQESAYVAAEMS